MHFSLSLSLFFFFYILVVEPFAGPSIAQPSIGAILNLGYGRESVANRYGAWRASESAEERLHPPFLHCTVVDCHYHWLHNHIT